MPVYVKIDEYKDILEVVDLIKAKLEQAKATLAKINELKNQEDANLGEWGDVLAELENKVDLIDQTLFEPTNV